MPTTVAQGASATVSLPAGSNIAVTGTGFAVMGPGRLQGTQYGLLGSTKVGPFDAAQTVYLTATTTALSYDIAPGFAAALPVITQRSATTGAPSGLIDPATGQPLGGGGAGGGLILQPSDLTYPMTRWRRRFARCASGGILTRITVFGDSNIGGTGAGSYFNEAGVAQNTGTFGLLGGYQYSIAQVMRDRLVARYGCPAGESFVGDQGQSTPGAPVNYSLIDGRIVYGTGWANATVKASAGGSWHSAVGATGGRLAFTPVGAWDTANVFTVRYSGGCTDARVYADGVQKTTLNLAGANALLKTQIAADARKVQALQFEGFATGEYLVVAAECYEAARPGLMVRQIGNSGTTSSAIVAAAAPWETGGFHSANPGALSIMYSTINDMVLLTPAQYRTNVQTWASRCTANGEDMLWIGCFPADDPQTTDGRLDALKAAAAEVLDPLGVNMIDLRDYMGSTWAIANSAGYMFDARHPNRTGHAFIGQIIADAIAG